MSVEEATLVSGYDSTEGEIDWYFASKNGAVEGPFEPGELRVLYENGKLNDSTYVWNSSSAEVHDDWLPISKIKHLYTYIFTRQGLGDLQKNNSGSESSLYELAKDHKPSDHTDNKEMDVEKGFSRERVVSEHDIEKAIDDAIPFSKKHDIEKAIDDAIPFSKKQTLPSEILNTANLDNVMDQLEAMQVEMKIQHSTLRKMDAMLKSKPKESSSELESSSSMDDDSSTSKVNFIDRRTVSNTNPEANVSRFTLQEAWDEVESKKQTVITNQESKKLSILLCGDKLRKLNIPATLRLSDVRKIVAKVEKVSPNFVELVHKGKLLTNNVAKLTELDVQNGDTLVIRVLSRQIKPHENILRKPKVPPKTVQVVSVKNTDVIKPPAAVKPLSEEELVLETYPLKQRESIKALVKAGFPQESVIVALEITKFNQSYAMEWLLSEEIQIHKKHDTNRATSIHDKVKDEPKPERASSDEKSPVQSQSSLVQLPKTSTTFSSQHFSSQVGHLPPVEEKINAGVKDDVVDDQKLNLTWGCPTCTFSNLEIMPYCEMCGFKKKSKAPPKFSKKNKIPDLPEEAFNKGVNDSIEEKMADSRSVEVEIRQNIPPAPLIIHKRGSSKNLIGSDRGNLKVTLIAAVGLMHKASYCLVTLGRLTKKTKPVKKAKTLEFDQVFFFNGFKPDSSRNLRVALMVEHKVRADRVVGQVSYALPLTFNSLSHDCIELTNQKNQTSGLLIISAVILQHGSKD